MLSVVDVPAEQAAEAPKCPSSLQQTALHWSAYYNNPEHAKLLIKHDSNIGIPDAEGKIPLHWAANHKDPSAVHTVRCILVSRVLCDPKAFLGNNDSYRSIGMADWQIVN